MIDEAAFVAHVEAYERTLYRISYSILGSDADCLDAVQNALTKAWLKRDTVKSIAFRAWLVRIVINECYSLHRKRRRETLVSDVEPAGMELPPDPSLREALDGLGDKLRLPVVLHYLEGFTVREVAHLLGIPKGTVQWRLSRARTLLRDALAEEGAMENA